MIIRLVAPNLRTCIVRCSCLGVEQTFLCNFGYIHITKFGSAILIQENICAL